MSDFETVGHSPENLNGKLEFVRIPAGDLETAHFSLGVLVKNQVHEALWYKLTALGVDGFKHALGQAGKIRNFIEHKIVHPDTPDIIQNGLADYLNCLDRWACGTQIDAINEELDLEIDPMTLALLLQHDNQGCQTALVRGNAGDIIFAHTEENRPTWNLAKLGEYNRDDFFHRIDRPRIVEFAINGDNTFFFLYPDLLPGSAFAFGKNYFQAVDYLPVKDHGRTGMLANAATWVSLFMGENMDTHLMLEALGPFVDGYALNVVSAHSGRPKAEKHVFAVGGVESYVLGSQPGDRLCQSNIFPDPLSPLAQEHEDTNHDLYDEMHMRRARLEHGIDLIGRLSCVTSESLRSLLSFSHGRNGFGNANDHVEGWVVGDINPRGNLHLWTGGGSAVRSSDPQTVLEF